MVKLITSGSVLVLILAGALFLFLDIIDYHEYYSLSWSIPVLNTLFITGIAAGIAWLAFHRYRTTGSWLVLGIGCAVVLFGTATALKAWLDLDLVTLISLRDYSVLLVAVVHLASVVTDRKNPGPGQGGWIVPSAGYAVSAGAAVLLTWLVHAGWLPGVTSGTGIAGVSRNMIQGMTAAIAVIAAFIAFRTYRKRTETWYVWYILGMLLFGFGELYIALGTLAGKLAWTGRVMQYLSGLYLFIMLVRYSPVSSLNNGITDAGEIEAEPG